MLVPYICYGTYVMVADEWALRVLRLDDVSFASQLDDLGDEFFKVWACQSKVRPKAAGSNKQKLFTCKYNYVLIMSHLSES